MVKTKLIFTLLAAGILISDIAIFPTVPGRAIAPASYYGPPERGTFNYGINTTYLYNYTYILSRTTSGSYASERWIPTLSNRTILSASGALYEQEFKILNETWTIPYTLGYYRLNDSYQNPMYYFDVSMPGTSSWRLNVMANYTLREIAWQTQTNVTMDSYNKTDGFYANYTRAELYINKSYPAIAANATLLNNSNPFTTARNVYNWVSHFLTYQVQPTDNGAEWAMVHKVGDCTEFSYLMVALLRACGIPARVLRGIVIADSSLQGVTPDFRAAVGRKWTFATVLTNGEFTSDNSTGHAWLEYFIPGAGWITADPTWNNAADYAMRIDNIHVPYMAGVWIGSGISPAIPLDSEDVIYGVTTKLSSLPYPLWVGELGVKHEVYYKFTVIHQEVTKTFLDNIIDFMTQNPLIILGLLGVILLVIIIKFARRVKKSGKSGTNDAYYRQRASFN